VVGISRKAIKQAARAYPANAQRRVFCIRFKLLAHISGGAKYSPDYDSERRYVDNIAVRPQQVERLDGGC